MGWLLLKSWLRNINVVLCLPRYCVQKLAPYPSAEVSLQCQTLSKLLKSPPSLVLQSWGKPGKHREFILTWTNCFSLGSSPSRCQLRGNRGACLFLCVSCALGLKFHCADGTARDPLAGFQPRRRCVFLPLYLLYLHIHPSSSTACPRVHKHRPCHLCSAEPDFSSSKSHRREGVCTKKPAFLVAPGLQPEGLNKPPRCTPAGQQKTSCQPTCSYRQY